MDLMTGMLLGALVGWTVSLFVEHRRWLPTRGDLLAGLAGGLAGHLLASTTAGAQAADANGLQILTALMVSGLAIAGWRIGRKFGTASKTTPIGRLTT